MPGSGRIGGTTEKARRLARVTLPPVPGATLDRAGAAGRWSRHDLLVSLATAQGWAEASWAPLTGFGLHLPPSSSPLYLPLMGRLQPRGGTRVDAISSKGALTGRKYLPCPLRRPGAFDVTPTYLRK